MLLLVQSMVSSLSFLLEVPFCLCNVLVFKPDSIGKRFDVGTLLHFLLAKKMSYFTQKSFSTELTVDFCIMNDIYITFLEKELSTDSALPPQHLMYNTIHPNQSTLVLREGKCPSLLFKHYKRPNAKTNVPLDALTFKLPKHTYYVLMYNTVNQQNHTQTFHSCKHKIF